MANYVSITLQMQHGCGIGARHIGQPHKIYRISESSHGDWIQTSNLLGQIWADRSPMKRSDPAFESSLRQDIFWFELLIDNTNLKLGDILVLNDPYLNIGDVTIGSATDQFVAFCMAAMPPVKHAIAARIDATAQLYRPALTPTNIPIGPSTLPYFDSTLPSELPLLCAAGQFVLGSIAQTAAAIPVGSMPLNNVGEIYSVPTPNIPIQERRRIYVPPLPGFVPKAGDKLIFNDGSRYVILNNYRQTVGTVGGQYLAEKEISGGIP